MHVVDAAKSTNFMIRRQNIFKQLSVSVRVMLNLNLEWFKLEWFKWLKRANLVQANKKKGKSGPSAAPQNF